MKEKEEEDRDGELRKSKVKRAQLILEAVEESWVRYPPSQPSKDSQENGRGDEIGKEAEEADEGSGIPRNTNGPRKDVDGDASTTAMKKKKRKRVRKRRTEVQDEGASSNSSSSSSESDSGSET